MCLEVAVVILKGPEDDYVLTLSVRILFSLMLHLKYIFAYDLRLLHFGGKVVVYVIEDSLDLVSHRASDVLLVYIQIVSRFLQALYALMKLGQLSYASLVHPVGPLNRKYAAFLPLRLVRELLSKLRSRASLHI